MLTKQEAHIISNFLQMIMSAVEMAQLHAERGDLEISKRYAENCKEQIRKITDFLHAKTLTP